MRNPRQYELAGVLCIEEQRFGIFEWFKFGSGNY